MNSESIFSPGTITYNGNKMAIQGDGTGNIVWKVYSISYYCQQIKYSIETLNANGEAYNSNLISTNSMAEYTQGVAF